MKVVRQSDKHRINVVCHVHVIGVYFNTSAKLLANLFRVFAHYVANRHDIRVINVLYARNVRAHHFSAAYKTYF